MLISNDIAASNFIIGVHLHGKRCTNAVYFLNHHRAQTERGRRPDKKPGMLANKESMQPSAQTRRIERSVKRHGMLANKESMQPSAHRQEEMSAQTKDLAC